MAGPSETTHTPGGDAPPETVKRAVAASAIGNATEWFDYGLYAYGVSYISGALFPGSTEDATLFALATFAISFLVRPLGGLFWGPLGDRLGRKAVLALTIVMMSGSTFCVGLIPSYDTIGFWAPTILIILRMVQGFSTGGEYGGAATFMAEYAPDRKRGFLGSFLEFGTLSGFASGATIMLVFSLVLSEANMGDWGWRIPFLIAAPLGGIGLYLRARMDDTPVFEEAHETGSTEEQATTAFFELCQGFWKQLLILGGMVVALNVANYTLLSYMPTYLQAEIGLTTTMSLVVPIIGMVAMMVTLPFIGRLSDKTGRKPLWWGSLLGLFVLAVPMYSLMGTNVAGAIVGFAVLGLLYAPQLATISATFPAMFPTQVRFAGFAIAYNVSTSLFGGTAPAVNDWFINKTGDNLFPAYYLMAACAVGAVAMLGVVETAGCSLRGSEIPGTDESKRELAEIDRGSTDPAG